MGQLTKLTALYLDSNELSGEIPAELGSLTNLQRLRLQNNQLTGPLPLTLSALSQLLVLNIQSTTLCAPTDTAFQAWLATINFQGSVCGSGGDGGGGSGGGGTGGGGGGSRTSAPSAPSNLTVVGGDGQVVLTWRAPSSDGGAEITDYEYRIDRRNPWISTGSTETTHTVTGLDNGTAYVFEVRAVQQSRQGPGFQPGRGCAGSAGSVHPGLCAFRQRGRHHLRSGVRESIHRAGPVPLSTSTTPRAIRLPPNRWWTSPAIWRSARTAG